MTARSGWAAVAGRVNLTLLTLLFVAATFWFTDHETNRHPAAPRIDRALAEARRAAHPPEAKIFILLLDSLRYDVAVDPTVMPNLSALRAEGAWAKVMPGFNASSAAAIRTAFTGRENAAVLAFVATFLKTDAGVESVFHQFTQEGYRVGAYSMGFFKQFGDGVAYERQLTYRSPPDLEDEGVDLALAAFNRGEFDVVVSHINYTDYAAHANGVGVPAYRAIYRRADALIPRIRRQLPPGTTFVVMSDHGHDELGRHGFGTDYPTIGVYCGPVFRQNLDLGTISLASHRYLLTKAAGLPMNGEGYVGDYLPQALKVHGNELASYLAEMGAGQALRPWTGVTWVYLSLLFAWIVNLAARGWSPFDFSGARGLVPWLAVPGLMFSGGVQLAWGLAGFGAAALLAGRGVTPGQALRWLGLPALAALAFYGWGYALWALRPALAALSPTTLGWIWATVGLAGLAWATRARRAKLAGWLVAAAALLLFPTNHPYGQSSALTPLLWCWFAWYAASVVRARGPAGLDSAALGRLVGAGAGVFLFMQMFGLSSLQIHLFAGWHSVIPGLDTENLVWMALAGFAAKAVIFFPRYPGLPRLLLGAGLITLLCFIDWRAWIPSFHGWLLLLAVSALAWRWARRTGRREEARLLGLTFLFLAYVYNIVPNVADFTETGCMLAGLVLAARLLRWFPQEENARLDAVILGVIGLYIAGWAMCKWSVTHLEWGRAYRWAPSPVVERYAIYLVPWIALKSTLPWVLAWTVLKDELRSARVAFPANELLIAMVVKIGATVLVNAGLGGLDTLNRGYLDGAQVSGLVCLLALGVVLLPRAWPRPAEATVKSAA